MARSYSNTDRRDEQIIVRLTAREKEEVLELAAYFGLTTSEVVRKGIGMVSASRASDPENNTLLAEFKSVTERVEKMMRQQ